MSADNTTRWTVTVTRETDAALRAYLTALGTADDDISTFIEEAVRWRMFDQTVQAVKAQNADHSAEELQTLIDDACAAVRSDTAANS